MPCPFPGMDPYVERPEIWPDFQLSLIAAIRGLLQPLLRPRYAAIIQKRVHGEESREPLVHLIEPAAGNRLVTAIEVLSPDDKAPGPGRASYLMTRDQLWEAGVNLVEIDLLRAGEATVRIPDAGLERLLPPGRCLVAVRRQSTQRQEVYAAPLERPLPRVGIPLSADEPDVTLDLQGAFTRCWNEGPYPELLRYAGPAPGGLTEAEVRWCEQVLREAGEVAG